MTNRAAAFFGCRPVRCYFKLCAPSLAHVQAREAGELDVVLIERAEAVEIAGLPGLGLAAEMQYRRVAEYPVEAALAAAAEEVGVIHTLCIRPSCSGRGYARQMVAFCEAEARRQGRTVIRLDTWEGNLPANRLYPSLGYRYAGTAEFFFMGFVRENLNCYEKAL